MEHSQGLWSIWGYKRTAKLHNNFTSTVDLLRATSQQSLLKNLLNRQDRWITLALTFIYSLPDTLFGFTKIEIKLRQISLCLLSKDILRGGGFALRKIYRYLKYWNILIWTKSFKHSCSPSFYREINPLVFMKMNLRSLILAARISKLFF